MTSCAHGKRSKAFAGARSASAETDRIFMLAMLNLRHRNEGIEQDRKRPKSLIRMYLVPDYKDQGCFAKWVCHALGSGIEMIAISKCWARATSRAPLFRKWMIGL